MIGKVLGNRYRVLREVGSGGMAWVYLAEDNKENRLVAVKILYPQFGEDLSYIQRFNREAKLASTLTDPHIVRVLDYGADRDVHYLVMEYIEGQDLREALNYEGRFPWKDALEIVDQLAAALEHAHMHGVVHRDIKPQNMMMDESGILKVLDFGIARVPTLPSLTQSGFIGSPYYVSPEQAMGEEVDTRADIYSSGIVLYELLSGSIPFDAKSPWSIISQHIASEPPPIQLDKEQIPEGVHRLLDRMIAKRPQDRFQTPSALRRAIAAVLAGQPIPDNTLDTQPIDPPDRAAMANSLYHRAVEAMELTEWARAVDLLNQALKFNPDQPEAAAKLAVAEREAQLTAFYNTGKRAMQGGLWEDAINSFRKIQELDSGYKDLDKLMAEAHEALKMEDTQKFVKTRYSEGVGHLEAERWDKAIEAFLEVQRLAPGHDQVNQLLIEAKQRQNPSLVYRLSRAFEGVNRGTLWRWALIMVGIIAIFTITFISFGNRTPTIAENPDVQQHLKSLYEEAQEAISGGDNERALVLLDQILAENPDYADVANLRRDLLATPTAVPTSTPTSSPTPAVDPLIALLQKAQDAIETEQWTEAIETLDEVEAANAEYETARLASLFCDAYVGRGLETLANLDEADEQKEIIRAALADFEAGVARCPRRTDLKDQADRSTAYLQALNTPPDGYDTLIQILTPVVAADPDYASKQARFLLYQAYIDRGRARHADGQMVGALSDYEAALALNVDDPSDAQMGRAELLLSFSQPIPEEPSPTPEAVAAATEPAAQEGTATPVTVRSTPTPEPVTIKYGKPQLIGPEDGLITAGQFAEVFLEWEPVDSLADDEYYDLTIMHVFADQPEYWGTATRDTRIQLSPDIGVGRAGGDRFYWWVTVRKANSAPRPGSLDLPLSPQSEARTFSWTP